MAMKHIRAWCFSAKDVLEYRVGYGQELVEIAVAIVKT